MKQQGTWLSRVVAVAALAAALPAAQAQFVEVSQSISGSSVVSGALADTKALPLGATGSQTIQTRVTSVSSPYLLEANANGSTIVSSNQIGVASNAFVKLELSDPAQSFLGPGGPIPGGATGNIDVRLVFDVTEGVDVNLQYQDLFGDIGNTINASRARSVLTLSQLDASGQTLRQVAYRTGVVGQLSSTNLHLDAGRYALNASFFAATSANDLLNARAFNSSISSASMGSTNKLTMTVVPEPSSVVLMGLGLLAVAGVARGRRA